MTDESKGGNEMPRYEKVAKVTDIAPGSFQAAEVRGRKIVLYNVDGTFYATDARCAHQGGPLGDGLLTGSVVSCPWHAWQFDVRTGEAVFDPGVRIACYAVKVEGDDVLVEG